ncbi:hypothetical protein T440DRAFT_466552 [Plenodomus tracheiphilus IPT5]|uniref:Uncharacterized protein n=1 Tax=Plenodomus tracheiphilus IPT5 TaxID=1408161 RepID=A0A6A7BFK8_9PLEO|nr:hypothetical protein T440DRAFT_466552 [Plenodomus tracheiphilus IPT5]
MPPKGKQRALATKPVARPIPAPFTPAPKELSTLLSIFDPSAVYIIHTDSLPAAHKKSIFIVPVLLNLFFTIILLWRAYFAVPHYWAIIMSFLGNPNETTIRYDSTPWGALVWKVVKRMLLFLGDFMLFRIVGPWPWTFFAESPGNPVSWRWNVGFRDEEVYVRQSRGWGAVDLLGAAEGASGKAGEDSPFFKTRILPAVDKERLRQKTGYLLMDGNFDLDFYGMMAATQLLDRKDITMEHLKKSVFVCVVDKEGEEGQWVMWDCSKLDQGSETEARDKVILFKDKLTEMGKESLFFKWVELIQYESNAPGGFTHERQIAAAEKAKKMFADQGVDFEEFSRELGGMEGMPGT